MLCSSQFTIDDASQSSPVLSTMKLVKQLQTSSNQLTEKMKDANKNASEKTNQMMRTINQHTQTFTNFTIELFKKHVLAVTIDTPITHPLKTAAERIENHHGKLNLSNSNNIKGYLASLKDVAVGPSWRSLYNGYVVSVMQKIAARNAKYWMQDKTNPYTQMYFAPMLTPFLGEKNSKTFSTGITGFGIGLATTSGLYPWELYRVRKQVNKNPINNIKFFDFFNPSNVKNFYNGVEVTALRDGLAGGIFFGVNNYLLVNKKEKPGPLYTLFAATVAGGASTGAAQFLDVPKTRIQTAAEPKSIIETIRKIIAEEGIGAFKKGLTANLAQAPFRVILPYLLYTYFNKDDNIGPVLINQPEKNYKLSK